MRCTRSPSSRLALAAVSAVVGIGIASAARAEYRSIGEAAAIMYDGPSLRAKRIYVASRLLPVEVISSDGSWVKVRDPGGDLAWVERKALVDRRTVLVMVPLADVRRAAEEASPVLFQAAQGVALEFSDQSGVQPGWVRVRHRDGALGFIRLREIWGA
ncbi:MAG: SH3 domain-containing protein [Burkholderiales bacterium]